jgi:hypothetical protein
MIAALSACSSLVTADRTKIPDDLFDVPKAAAGSKSDKPDTSKVDAGADDAGM